MSVPVTRKRSKKTEKDGEASSNHGTTDGNRPGPASRGDPQSPTAQIALAKAKSELELLKLKVSSQQEKIKDLEEERDFLRKQLNQANKNIEEKEDNEFKRKKKTVVTDSSSFDSSESSSDSISTDSSLEKKKKKKRLKERQRKKEKKNHKEKKGVTFHRVGGPAEVIRRYEKVLAIYTKGSTMAKAFQKYGVDRNTIATTASIAELFVAAPETYHKLHGERDKKEKVLDFAKKCSDVIVSDQSIAEKICNLKLEGKLLPIQKK